MESEKELQEFFSNGHLRFLPHVSIDCAIFGFHENQLKILLIKWKQIDGWCLPGGFINRAETIDEAAHRILKERTGLSKLFLQQFQTFGDLGREKINGMDINDLSRIWNVKIEEDNWLIDRTVSIGYYALVEYSKVSPQPDYFSEECSWRDIHEIPDLMFDHNKMVDQALKTLRLQIYHQPVGLNLLPEKFTLPQIQGLYETILDKKLDRRNFQKKIMGLGILNKHEERKKIGPHRSPYLYSFNQKKYKEALSEGISFAF